PLVKGAGMVYICNPNNPTSTINGGQEISDFIAEVRKTSPTTAILFDEAYSDYATDKSFQSAIPLALSTPNVLVAKTFSKAYGMAGGRIGYPLGATAAHAQRARDRLPHQPEPLGVAAGHPPPQERAPR